MNHNRHIITIFFALMLLLGTGVQAQRSNILYASQRMPLNSSLNPAFFPERNKVYISMPSMSLNFSSPLSYSDIFSLSDDQSYTKINLDNISRALQDDSHLLFNGDIHLMGFGFKLSKLFFNGSLTMKTSFKTGLPTGLFDFINNGNVASDGSSMRKISVIDGEMLNIQAYGEAALGGGVTLGNLTVGAKLKFLAGLADVSTVDTKIDITTAADLSSITADLNYRLRSSLPVDFGSNGISFDVSNLSNMRNLGFAIDLGAKYYFDLGAKIGAKKTMGIDFSASILDIGKINWKSNVKELIPQNGETSFSFTGIDISGLISGGNIDTSVIAAIRDTINNFAHYTTVDGQAYSTTLPTRFNVGAIYNLDLGSLAHLRAGVMFHGEYTRSLKSTINTIQKSIFRSNTTAVASINLHDWVELMASASVVSDGKQIDWFNPGFGVNVSIARTVSIYAIMDYISNIYLVDAKSFNICLGMNLLLINSRK